MTRLSKKLLKTLIVLMMVPLALALAIPHWLDPNDYKPEITAWVEDATGRRLTLEGDLGWSLLPWLGLEVRKASLSQPRGLGEGPFLRVLEAQVRIKPLPLLRGRVELAEILGRGVSLQLRRDRSGRASWDDWGRQRGEAAVRPSSVASPAQGSQPWPELSQVPALPTATGQGLTLAGVEILWDDQQTGSRLRLQELDLSLAHLDSGLPLELRLAGRLGGLGLGDEGRLSLEAKSSPPADGHTLAPAPFTIGLEDLKLPKGERLTAKLSGVVQGDLSSQAYIFPDLSLGLGLTGGLFADRALEVSGKANLDLDYRAQTLALRDLVLASGQLRLQGQASATQVMDRPKFEGKLALAPLDLRSWLEAFSLPLPVTADPKAYSRLALASDWRWVEGRLDLRGLDLTLDQTRASGNLAWWSGAGPGAEAGQEFDLRADRLDLDAYLPPAVPAATPPSNATGALLPDETLVEADPAPLLLRLLATRAVAAPPLAVPATAPPAAPAALAGASLAEALGTLNLNGRFRIDQLIFKGLSFGDFDGQLSARQGRLGLKEQVGSFYDGTLAGQIALDGTQAPPLLTLHQQGKGLNMGDLLRDLRGEDRLRGTGQIEADLNARGLTREEMLKTLTGTAGLRISKGQLQGIDLEGAIQRAAASLQGRPGPAKAAGPEATEFRDFNASARIDQGLLTTQDLEVRSGYLRAKGGGRIDLMRDELDLRLEARVVDPPADQPLSKVEGIPIPIRVAGSFQFPEWRIDAEPVVRELAKRRIQKELDKGDSRLLRQLEEGTGIKGLEQGLKSLLGR